MTVIGIGISPGADKDKLNEIIGGGGGGKKKRSGGGGGGGGSSIIIPSPGEDLDDKVKEELEEILIDGDYVLIAWG